MNHHRNTLKNLALEQALVHRRLLLALLVVLCLFALLVWRYADLQITHHELYQTRSHANRVHLQRLAPQRGLIVDREQRLLAENRPSYRLVVYRDQVADLDATLAGLQQLGIIDERDIELFRQRAYRYRSFEAMPLRFHLDDREIARFSVQRMHYEGVEIEADLMRHYPHDELLAHMLGYVGRINATELAKLDADNYGATTHIGKIGVEKQYETALHGQVGYAHVETNARGQVLRTLETELPVPGSNLQLHLDLDLQRAAYQALAGYRGAIVALDTRTGGVLAVVSTPSYDSNLFVRGISHADYDRLRDDLDLPLFNRVLQAQYPPGSTVKPVVGMAGLDKGVVTMASTVYDPGWYQLPDNERLYRDWKREGHGDRINFIDAMEQSCDVYYYDLAFKLGARAIHEYFDLFGLGRPTGIDVPSERSGINPSGDWKRSQGLGNWFGGDTLNIGIGQGFLLATPLQLAQMTSIIANRGRVLVPQMVAAVDGVNLPPQERAPVRLQDERNWQHVIDSMVAAVHGRRATARGISRNLDYRIAGKTGTAQVVGIPQGEKYDASQLAQRKRDHALFVAFAPADEPAIAVAVVVENGEHGSTVAAPMARRVIELWLDKTSVVEH